eukprot:scaffold2289_cov162-Ochromonas_danica.AAC.1
MLHGEGQLAISFRQGLVPVQKTLQVLLRPDSDISSKFILGLGAVGVRPASISFRSKFRGSFEKLGTL